MKKALFILFGAVVLSHNAWAELSAAKFPGTIEDVSFVSRVENLIDGYKPFLDKSAYQELNVVSGEEMYTDHMLAVMEYENEQQKRDAIEMSITEYCAKYPDDYERCPQETPETTQIYANYTGYTIGGGTVVENYIVVGGSCYPADHDKWYKNKIYTTGRFENQYPAFEKGLITLFRKEGVTCGTIRDDPGGFTCMGISSRFQKIPPETLKNYTIKDAEDLYYERFWNKYKLYKLPDVISADIFLAGVASGMGTAMQNFRVFLGLAKKASAVDDEMVMAVNNYNGDIHNRWMDLRKRQLEKVAAHTYHNNISYNHAVEIKRKNGCHVKPQNPLYR